VTVIKVSQYMKYHFWYKENACCWLATMEVWLIHWCVNWSRGLHCLLYYCSSCSGVLTKIEIRLYLSLADGEISSFFSCCFFMPEVQWLNICVLCV